MSHHIHERTFNFQSVKYTVRGGIFCYKWNISKLDMFTFEAQVFWNLDFVFSRDNLS